MKPVIDLHSWIILMIIGQVSAVSYNQPQFCANAAWDSNATTFANSSLVGANSFKVFVSTNNTVYVVNQEKGQVLAWAAENMTLIRNISGLMGTWTLFVTVPGDIYTSIDSSSGQVDKFTLDSDNGIPTMYTCQRCYDIFVNFDDTLYCSMDALHQVVTKSLKGYSNTLIIVAGTGTSGNTSNLLNSPKGIFVDLNFNLYVADSFNHRIQRFSLEQFDGITVAGNDLSNVTIALSYPTSVILDDGGYLFIADSGNNRIVGSGPNGFRCIVGCYNSYSSAPDQLSSPMTLSFDRYGNIFVADYGNNRTQKFILMTNSCALLTTTTSLLPTTTATDNEQTSTNTFQSNYVTVPSSSQSTYDCSDYLKTTTIKTSRILLNDKQFHLTFNSNSNVLLLVVSYNQPKLSTNASWSADATTLGTNDTTDPNPSSVFVNTNNTIYVADRENSRILVWYSDSFNPAGTITANLSYPMAIFVSISGDIYADNGYTYSRVDKLTMDTNSSVPVMNTDAECVGIFIDSANYLYCSLRDLHKVIKQLLDSISSITMIVAGIGCNGSTTNMLNKPRGIFVAASFDLYVADSGNNRIQLFRPGELNGITVAGNESSNTTITLNDPLAIVLDGDGYLFIADSGNNRIIGSGPSGFRCIVGCSSVNGSAADQLSYPTALSFDNLGNIFVADFGNNRVQKFLLLSMSSEETTAAATTDQTQTEELTSIDATTTMMEISIDATTTMMETSIDATTAMMETSIDATTTMMEISIDATTTMMETSINAKTTMITTSVNPTTAMMTTSKTSIGNQKCFAPRVTLIPATSSLSSPLQFRRNQDFYVGSNIDLDCNISLSTIMQWTISRCTSTCSSRIVFGQSVITTFSELYVPARTLDYGVYELKLTVTMSAASSLFSSASAYVQIKPSGITVNLFQLGTSMITSGRQKDLKLDPGTFSVDPDRKSFNGREWSYNYYCRIYGFSKFPNANGALLTIDDPTIDPQNPSCLSNSPGNGATVQYVGVGPSSKSAILIRAGSLQSNRTYQFMTVLQKLRDPLSQATGYVLVRVEETSSPIIAVGCVISTMCVANMEFQLLNPTTQVALFALCVGNCVNIRSITWNIYQGVMNPSSNTTQWTLFSPANQQQNSWFFGRDARNFTATNKLLLSNAGIDLWRFEVVYSFISGKSASALNFLINRSPSNGSCSISPLNGTTSTLFNIFCIDWFDKDGIKDYSLYSWTTNPSKRTLTVFSPFPTFQVRLPAGNSRRPLIHLTIYIRDTLECITELDVTSVRVVPDTAGITDLVNVLQSPLSSNNANSNPIIRLLASGNQNVVGQLISSLSQEFNQQSDESIDNAVSSGVPVTSISISSLGSTRSSTTPVPLNVSALDEFNKQLNSQANIRDYLVTFTINLTITTIDSIKLQASSLAQLTQATNQLTRATLTIASNKCYQLSLALQSMSGENSYEDVQTAATNLAQCASNVLSAVNGPLQERTTILDLDLSRSTKFPDDYDTDIESEWSNLNLFLEGNDFSDESIEQSRNRYYQRQLANQLTGQTKEILSFLSSAMNIHLNIGQNSTIDTPNTFMSLETISMETLSNKTIQQVGSAQILLPAIFNSNLTGNSTISLRSTVEPLAPADSTKFQVTNTNLSTSISLSLLDQYGTEMPLQSIVDQPIEIIIPRDPNLAIPAMMLQDTFLSTPHNQLFNLHYSNITGTINISVHWEIHPLNSSVAYLFVYKLDAVPQLNTSINLIDGWTLLCPSNLSNDSIYTYYIDNQRTSSHQSVIFGLRELNSTEMADYCSNTAIISPPITSQRYNFTANYEWRSYTSGCYYLDKNNLWKSDGLVVGPRTNYDVTQCFSTHLTKFTGGFRVVPTPINWNYVFANADFMKNKTIYLTVICVSVIYILLVIFARYKDRKDLEKLGVTPLSSNHQSDQYFYQILVFTGQRKDSGTKSKVHFILYGNEEKTHVGTLADPQRLILQRGGIDAFIMAVPKSLGLLNCVRIWHDNTGQGSSASWFLKYIIVRDLQTMEKFHFISQQWFAVEKDDGKVERVLPVAGEMEKREFTYILSKRAYHSISDGHLWFSIFSRPASNQFTRVQRCTCCFVLFYISMFLNIMYYDLSSEAKTTNGTSGVSLGPIYLSSQQILIGIIVELIALMPSLLVVQLFRRLRPRQKPVSPLRQALHQMKSSVKFRDDMDQKKTKQKSRWTLPWWWIFIAYGICVLLVGLSIIFLIGRGIEFGESKTQQWLGSILTGFFSSVLLTQPLKILSLAIFFAIFCHKPDNDQEAEEFLDQHRIDLENDEEHLHSIEACSSANRSVVRADRLNAAEVDLARRERLQEIQMWSILREIFIYVCFLSILFVITYSNHQSNSFLQVDHLRKFFLNSRKSDLDYTKISTINGYWNWLENSFVSNVRAQQWYNDEAPRNLSGFINDKSNRLIGWPTMRQLRVKPDLCSYQTFRSDCLHDYSLSNEEQGSFPPGWINETVEEYTSSIRRAFQYQSNKELDTYVYIGEHGSYSGNGYVYEFRGRLNDIRSNLSELHRLGWIDNRTRAVIIQLSLYNPNVELFTSVTFLIELLSTGGVWSSSRFEPFNFYLTSFSKSQLICSIIYIIMIIYFMFEEIQLFIQLKRAYFRRFQSYMELGIIISSWINVRIYIWRYQEFQRISSLFRQTNGYVYINLQLASYVNDISTYLFAYCCFFGTIRFLHLCQLNRRLSLFSQTLRNAGKKLFLFSMMFSIVFIAFLCLFYFLFNSHLWSCSSLLHTAQMLFEIILMKFDAHQLIDAAAFLGPFVFSLFILLVVFVCMSMFLSIINESFCQARESLNRSKDKDIFSFMFERFRRWTGWKKSTKEEIPLEQDDPTEHFPERVDQLLDKITRLYTKQRAKRLRIEKTTRWSSRFDHRY